MLVFASEFPLSNDFSTAKIMSICREWIISSPHYPWAHATNIGWESNEIRSSAIDGQTLDLGMHKNANTESIGLRHKWIENDSREWATEIACVVKPEYCWLSVKIYCEDFVPGLTPPNVKKPYILKQIFSSRGGGLDGCLVVQDKAHFLKTDDLEFAANLINGKLNFDLPILYVSSNFDGHPFIDVDTAARWLSGIAHIVVEPSRQFSISLSKLVNEANPYGGAISIYWPGRNGKSYRFLPFNYADSREMILEAQEILRGAWLYTKSENDCSWNDIQQRIYQEKITSLKSASSGSLDDFMAAFDGENEALRSKIKQLESRLQAAQYSLQNIQAASTAITSIGINKGSENDLYPHEIKDCIIATLTESLDRMNTESRRYHVISDITSNNRISSERLQIESEIKRIISKTSRITSSEIAGLKAIGFEVDASNKHPSAVFNGDPRYAFTLFSTASDHRAGDNLASDMIRKLIK
jgi:hypothetical protein